MCGFVVRLGEDTTSGGFAERIEKLKHRGPDDSGSWVHPSGRVGFFHRRLSIIDLEGGAQPMCRNGSAVVYNGEIYNYRKLRKQLAGFGLDFRTDSDTEVLLNGYLHWGREILDRVRGMFSFCLWDESRGRLFLARDHLGQKPLFYYAADDLFLAASELEVFLGEGSPVAGRLNPAPFGDYFRLGYVPVPQTAVRNVKKLPPGHLLTVESDCGVELKKYWDPVDKFRSKTQVSNPRRELREKLETAVERRLVSDVPVGAFLSGGIDSTIIVGLLQQLKDEPVRTVTVGFSDDRYDERDYGRLVAREHGTDHHEYEVDLDISDLLPDLVRRFGEPFADSSAVPTYYVARETREVVKVALAGDGGDELFGGYRRYRAMQWLNRIRQFSPEFLRQLFQSLGRSLGSPATRRSTLGELIRIVQHLAEDPVNQYQMMVGLTGTGLPQKFLTDDFLDSIEASANGTLLRSLSRDFPADIDPADWGMLLDILAYLPGDLLVKTDITTMMNSLECRCPFLDRDVVEMALAISTSEKIGWSSGKLCLRRTFSDLMPDRIKKRGKQGFGVPLARWFRRDPEASYLRQILLDKDRDFFNLLDREVLEEQLSMHRRGEVDLASFLWAVTTFKLWYSEMGIKI